MSLAPAVLDGMTVASQPVGILSVEALAQHTADGVQDTDSKVPASTFSTNKTSTMGAKKNSGSNPTASVVYTFKHLFTVLNAHNYIYSIIYIYFRE